MSNDQPAKPSSDNSSRKVNVNQGDGPQQWTNEQQKQLESGLSTYPASLGLSQQERWRAIAEMVEVSKDTSD